MGAFFVRATFFAIVKYWKKSNAQLLTIGKNCMFTVVNDGIFLEMCALYVEK